MRQPGIGTLLATGLLVLPLAAGCASKKQVQEYQDEIASLREERARLKKENRELEMRLDDYAVALAEANQKREAAAPAPSYPDLDAAGIDYGQKNGMFYLSIPSEITFPSGKADLTSGGKKALKTVAATLMQKHGDKTFWIEGHTDTDPIKKSSWGSNRELSIARAMAVLHYLVEDCGVPDDQCVIAGHGQYEPVAKGASASDKARNRRVEIVVHAAGAKP